MIVLAFALIAFGLGLFFQAIRLDRQLRKLSAIRIESRWASHEPSSPFEHLEAMLSDAFPAHWRLDARAGKPASLANQLWLCLGLGWCFAIMGVMLLAEVA